MEHDGDQVYGKARARELEAMLRALAERLQALDRAGQLLEASTELLERLGTIRSELFHYEVRQTYDTPEVAEHRRLVDEAGTGWTPDNDITDEDDETWHRHDPQ
jgi:hypothetical protein